MIDAIWHSIPIVIKHFNPSVMWLIPISFFTLISDALLILLLNIFFIYNFKIRRKTLHILINLIAILVIFMIEKTSGRLLQLMWFYSVILIIESVSKKRPGSIPALLGVLILLIEPIHIILSNTLPSLRLFHQLINVSFIFFMLLSVSSQIRAQNRERQSSLIRSARLETELLKRNIQPHFLMNTLLSVISLIKESPSKAIRLIDAFADEFRIINRISSKKLIPIDEEIQLCESHLALMEFRKEAHYQFIRSTIDEDEMVPPMIFHTLIENGLTHAFQAGENGTFKLYYKKDENHIQYCLKNDGSRLKSLSNHPGFHIEDGMGLRYVKARLEENFPNKWQMAYHLKNGWWEVNITIER